MGRWVARMSGETISPRAKNPDIAERLGKGPSLSAHPGYDRYNRFLP